MARSRRPLVELPQVRVFGQPQGEQALRGEWRLLRIAGGQPPDLDRALAPVVAATRAPALVTFVLDSDCAVMCGRTPTGAHWATVLNRDLALGYDGVLETYDTPDHGRSGAIQWAREAGLMPMETAVSDVLDRVGTFVDVIDRLPATFGILGVAEVTRLDLRFRDHGQAEHRLDHL